MVFFSLLTALFTVGGVSPTTEGSQENDAAQFLKQFCVRCHGPEKPKAESERASRQGKRDKAEGRGKGEGKGQGKGRDGAKGATGGVRVEFVKTYDGTGGVLHSVWYSGRFDPETFEITGTWELGEGYSGTFVMKRAGSPGGY